MNDFIGRVFGFEKQVFPTQSALYADLVSNGQSPTALMIGCADSRVAPEHVMQAAPGDLFVCRNAGNIVPPFATMNGGVSSTVEYAVMALGVREIIVCGHSDCGAMKALGKHEVLAKMPNVAGWLRHSEAALRIVEDAYPDLSETERVHAVALENIAVQLAHLRTHPSVAAALARGKLTLHGWFVDIHAAQVLALNGETGRFEAVREDQALPVAQAAGTRRAAEISFLLEAAE